METISPFIEQIKKKLNYITIPVLVSWSAFFILATERPLFAFEIKTEKTIKVSNEKQLIDAVRKMTSSTTVLLAPGIYDLGQYGGSLEIRKVNNIIIKGQTDKRDDVTLIGQGMNQKHGKCQTIIHINRSYNVMVANMTLKDAWYHLVQVHGENGAQSPYFKNLHLLDCGEQFIKSCCGANNGVVEDCLFEFTTHGRWHYTGGVDVLNGDNWIIRDNVFKNIRGPKGQLSMGAILLWRQSKNSIVERNKFIECDFGIGFGNPKGRLFDHEGGIIKNNFFFRKGKFGDAAITLNRAKGFKVYHNTLISRQTFPWVMDYRFQESSGEIFNNITDGKILARDGGSAVIKGNVTKVKSVWFKDFEKGDLHLRALAESCIDKAVSLPVVKQDIDCEHRGKDGKPSDIGADEFLPQ